MTKKEILKEFVFDLECKAAVIELELLKTFTSEQEALYLQMEELTHKARIVQEGD